jgi:hypothetical protein
VLRKLGVSLRMPEAGLRRCALPDSTVRQYEHDLILILYMQGWGHACCASWACHLCVPEADLRWCTLFILSDCDAARQCQHLHARFGVRMLQKGVSLRVPRLTCNVRPSSAYWVALHDSSST